MAKVTIDWGEEHPMDEFKVTFPIARAVFTLLSRISDTWTTWTSLKNKGKDVYLCDPEKNESCSKEMCQTACFFCTEREFSRDETKLRFNGSSFVPYFPEEVDAETGKPPENHNGLNENNKITEFRKDEENKTPEL